MKKIGEFECEGLLQVGDAWVSNWTIDALQGIWHCYKTVLPADKTECWFNREANKELIVIHNDFLYLKDNISSINILEEEDCAVDSCTAGVLGWRIDLWTDIDTLYEENDMKTKREAFFEEEYKKHNKPMPMKKFQQDRIPYHNLFELYHEADGVTALGAIVWSGYGDGCYPVYTLKNENNEVYAVRISFIVEDSKKDIHPKCN